MPRRRRAVSDETQRVLTERQARLTSLTRHPEWPELVEEVARKRARIEKTVATLVLGNKPPVDTHKLAYLNGFVAGIEWFAQVPVAAEESLERFLRDQGVLSE